MLDAASRLFSRQRFHEVRMEDIAAEAEVGKGTLYRYFSDKEELYLALLRRASTQLRERLRETVAQHHGPRARLQAVVDGIVAFFDAQPHLLDLIQRAEVLQGPDFPGRQTRDELLRLVLALFEEAKTQGEFVVRDPDVAALLLLGGLRSVIRFGQRPRPPDLARRIVDIILQ